MATGTTENIQVCIAGSADFVRRMSTSVRSAIPERFPNLTLSTANLTETRALVLAERPHVLVVDVSLRTSQRDLEWMRNLLQQFRERLGKKIYIILAITNPEKLMLGGDLLFSSDDSLSPSGLIDNFIIAPPPGIPGIMSLEEQLRDCLTYVVELREEMTSDDFPLPALWEDGWVPVMCDSESRNVWMRWLPRYARYVNENPIIVGPTGAGKTRLAAAIHQLSGRTGPFVSITPRDFSSTELVQAELFGAVSGAYTGAVDKWGLVRRAEKGTLFIDELQSIDRDLQGKLITFIENKTYRRVGEAESHEADVRFVFATNRPLQILVEEGSLRDDFAYRLERLQIELSPLHQRRLDIAAGISFSLARVLRERAKARGKAKGTVGGKVIEGLTAGAYQLLFCALWPGNLRQLENTIAKLIEFSDIKHLKLIDRECSAQALEGLLGQSVITATDIFEKAAVNVAIKARSDGFSKLSECMFELAELTRREALDLSGGDVNKAATLIGDSARALRFFAASRNTTFGFQ